MRFSSQRNVGGAFDVLAHFSRLPGPPSIMFVSRGLESLNDLRAVRRAERSWHRIDQRARHYFL